MNIVYVGNIGVEGTAMSVHAQNLAWILEQGGNKVSFICLATGKGQKPILGEKYFYPPKRTRIFGLSTIDFWMEEYTGSQMFSILKNIKEKIDIVILYGCRGENRLIKYCHDKKITVLMDAVDWFETSDKTDFLNKIYIKYYVDHCRTKVDKKLDGVIAISNYLCNYYSNRMGVKAISIPPVFEMLPREVKRDPEREVTIKLVYAGSIGEKKDSIAPVVMAVKKINESKKRFRLDLIGISQNQLDAMYGKQDWESLGIIAHGRVSHKESRSIVEKADFSFLLRANKTYAKAGFSTKFVESMCSAVPVICTAVGGADTLICDNQNGMLVYDNDQSTIEAKLYALLELTDEEILQMKKNAYATALQYFDRNKYIKELNGFISEIRGGNLK